MYVCMFHMKRLVDGGVFVIRVQWFIESAVAFVYHAYVYMIPCTQAAVEVQRVIHEAQHFRRYLAYT